ncbi:MAG TPA: hypothetical protein ENJ00_01375 [Phycisphaerales bacterium]|nr:hypothetical protein [Phycisphaerales bacterium]
MSMLYRCLVCALAAFSVHAQVDTGQPADQTFVEQPGVMEFSGQMIVRPRQDLYAATNPAPNASPAKPMRVFQQAEATDRARARLLPNAVEFFGEVDEYIVNIPEGMDENSYAKELMATGDYEYVEPNWIVFPVDTVPNDPNFSNSWQHTKLQSVKAWDIVTGDASSIVSIIDTGIDLDHPDLQDLLLPGFNAYTDLTQAEGGDIQDYNGHGTFCAGCAAAHGNNATQVVGAGWNFQIMPVRVNNGGAGTATGGNLNQGARWAADNGATVTSVSWSGVQSASVQTTAKYCREQGCLYFRAAGNDNVNLGGFDHEDAVVVGASTTSDTKAGFSNYGRAIDVFAPGAGVRSTTLGGGQGTGSGTSFACPISAGVAALIHSARPELRPRDLRDILYASADDLGAPGEDDTFGHGRVNSFQAVQMAPGYCPEIYFDNAPADVTLCEGSDLNITMDVGALNPTYQWYRDGSALTGQTSPTLAIAGVLPSDEGLYTLEVTTDCRVAMSVGMMVLVTELVSITDQPVSQTVEPGSDVTFSVVASGDVDSYLWFKDGTVVPGEVADTLVLSNVSDADEGGYSSWVIGQCGEVEFSTGATLTVEISVPCIADVNGDGLLDSTDFTAWIAAFNQNDPAADQNEDGLVAPDDFTAWISNFNAGCP